MILGAAGMLGRALCARLARSGASPIAVDRAQLDLTGLDAVEPFVRGQAPAAVINAAAFTDVDGAEDPARAAEVRALNHEAPARIAAACRRLGVPLIHVSTDYVFDGRAERPYREEDPVGPLQVYGRSKLDGERAVLGTYPEALVARTSTLFGARPADRPSFVGAVLRSARTTGRVRLVHPPTASPTYAPDLAGALLELLDHDAHGVVHVVNDGAASRFELGKAAIEAAGLAGRVEVREREAAPGGIARPDYSVLDTSRLGRILGHGLRPWRDALGEFVRGGA
jgi:dTDP-4-dehydrorhamnose reductase